MELPLPLDFHAPILPPGLLLKPRAIDLPSQKRLFAALGAILQAAPPILARVKGGGKTSAAMSNCGPLGWWSDAKGYRYEARSPVTGQPWPAFPVVFLDLVRRITADTSWPDFTPDACLINFYGTGARMGLHQDKDERDFTQPIVTVSLGDTADWLIGGATRTTKARAFTLSSGDVLVMGGPARRLFHGVRKVHPGTSPLPEIAGRYSLTFRKAL